MSSPVLEKHLTLNEAADYVGLKHRSLRRYCVRGELDGAYQRKRRWYIPASALARFQQAAASEYARAHSKPAKRKKTASK